MPEIINKSIVGLGFGYLHDEEIKKLSVKQITNSSTFDSVRQPILGGLYDRAMGPTEPFEQCETCGLSERECPGHPGHVQLAVPVYNVFLFELLLKLLNMKCWNCHHLRLNPLKKKSILAQLLYLEAGQILRAREVAELGTGSSGGKTHADANIQLDSCLDQHISHAKKFIENLPLDGPTTYTSHTSEVRHKLVKQFLAMGRTPKCSHCGACSPSVRRDGFTKIFVQPLNSTQRHDNEKLGIRLWSILSNTWDNNSSDPTPAAANVAPKTATAKKRAAAAAAAARKTAGSDSESEDSDDGEQDIFEDDDEQQKALFGEAAASTTASTNNTTTSGTSSTNVEETQARLILPNEVERHMNLLWQSGDAALLSVFFAPATRTKIANCPYSGNDYRAFFHRVLLIPPSRFRPPSFLHGEYFESSANVSYRKIFDSNEEIVRSVFNGDNGAASASFASNNKASSKTSAFFGTANSAEYNIEGLTPVTRKRVIDAWMAMQHEINLLFDSDKTGSQLQSGGANTGIKQLLEKKQGLFRKHMMGKRVNFAARSVISPDPYLHSREIGVPDIFAKVLTYPEPVNAYNLATMRQAIINGPSIHPGANKVIDGRGREIKLDRMSRDERIAFANSLLSKDSSTDQNQASHRSVTSVEKNLESRWVGDAGPYVVLRHLRSGDVLLVNRQPTLHKPSMMAHVARVLYGENVLRMHYSNCATYNADFDGDEMNLHFPQNELARIEAYDVANNDNQYIVPTNGGPLRGLIQDHVICGVRLTSRDCFLNREYFQQFLFLAIADQDVQRGHMIRTTQPAILKPRPMWTGKQLINSILDYIANDRPPLNMSASKTKVPGAIWGKQGQEDGFVVIRQNRFVHGVLDKSQFGASNGGLVHSIYELYGARAASDTLTILSRLFTRVLQYDAFTCGLEDFLLTTEADIVRRGLVQHAAVHGIQATADCAGMEGDVATFGPNKINEAVQRFYHQHSNAGEMLDNAVKAALGQDTSNIIKACIPGGQRTPFPRNQMAMMTLTGAKGSAVNHSQIACLLGQQELEGRRVPVTMAGKTLPSFPRYDPQPRAGGYIAQRFFTGIKPQEYYFHCMAGREGLVDTAVKTANSGYLQRCIIKLLESLAIRYDNTVRDCDGGLVQFAYGEDGIDVTKSAYLNNMHFYANNFQPLMAKLRPSEALDHLDCTSILDKVDDVQEQRDALEQLIARHEELVAKEDAKLQSKTSGDKKPKTKDIEKVNAKRQDRLGMIAQAKSDLEASIAANANPDPKMFSHPFARTLGAISEKFEATVEEFIKDDPEHIFSQSDDMKERWENQLEDLTTQLQKVQQSFTSNTLSAQSNSQIQQQLQARSVNLQEQINRIKQSLENRITPDKFRILMNLNYISSLAAPGENVGVLAGQSVGEPSTQMTLNTFHLAGHGGANVTLGIPRLREIVMTGSDHISTPIMEIPLIDPSPAAAAKLAAKLNKVRLNECLSGIHVAQSTKIAQGGSHEYKIRLDLLDLQGEWASNNLVSIYHIITCVCTEFARKLNVSVKQKLRASQSIISSRTIKSHADIITNSEDVAEDAGVNNDEVNNALSAAQRRQLKNLEEGSTEVAAERKKKQQSSYDDDDDENEEVDDVDNEDVIDKDAEKQSSAAKTKKEDKSGANSDSEDDDEDDSSSDSDDDAMTDDRKSTKKVTKVTKKPAAPLTAGEIASSIEQNIDLRAFMRQLQASWGVHDYITKLEVDYENNAWIEITVTTPQGAPKLLMLSTVERLCEISRVRYTEGINRAMVVERKSEKGKYKIVQTDGVNLRAVWNYPEVDQTRIKTNDIHQILKHYGVEAAAASIRNEISGVFGVYGIGVDQRHLSLIADFMTFRGFYNAMNRISMTERPSVMQKASFETSLKFVVDACNTGEFDHLSSPSSSIVVGKPIQSGTNMFEVKQPLVINQI